jgi:regulator of protease activity HflC (stomatin/prohibitin superfamily)
LLNVQFAVVDPKAAMHAVASYEDRLYSDVQLAGRRSLASMTLEDILTNRTRLSEDILREVKEAATSYGVAIARADVKDLVFPGNLQEIMNRVLAAERVIQAQLDRGADQGRGPENRRTNQGRVPTLASAGGG